jgi:GTP-binding protein EngB required for normal cell division
MKKQKLPIRSSSQKKEDISKRKFEDLIEPWVVCAWEQKDYGIDATVEIHKLIDDTNDSHPTSKRFLVQLKATTSIDVDKRQFNYPVDVEKINYWYNSNLPVLFAVYHIPSKKMYYRWINDSNDLINYFDKKLPGWALKSKVNIPINTKNILTQNNSEEIEGVVFNWRIPAKKIITPGNYFNLKEETVAKIDEIEKIAAQYKFPSIAASLKNLKDLSEQAIYRIAITGPSRVGKSTLINSLLEYEISPVDMFQTTGVPINFLPGREERLHIMKNDGSIISDKLSEKNIRKYASQQENRDNQKQIKLVSVFLHNKALERGVAFYDIPGLDDPNDEIRNLTWMTAMRSNAVIYMIDASPFRNHGFIFRSDFRKSLADLGGQLDKVFLVLNKVDDLHQGQLPQLRSKIEEELKRFGLFDKINKRIFYLSAKKKRTNLKDKPDSVTDLEAEIWEYLLKENKVGLVKMDKVIVETGNVINGFKSLIETRLLDNEQRASITKLMNDIKKKVPEFSQEIHNDKILISQTLHAVLSSRKNSIYEQLLKYLQDIPENKSLPSTSYMKEVLRHNINQTINSTNIDYLSHVTNLKAKFDNWISTNITAVQKAISKNQPTKYVNITNIERIEFKNIEDMSNSVGMGFFTGALGFLIAPPAALLLGLGGFIMSWFLSKTERRERGINKIMASCKSKCDEDISIIESAYNELLEDNFDEMRIRANDHLNKYFQDLTDQLQKLDIALPSADLEKMKKSFIEIDKLSEELKKVKGKIEDSYFSLS